MLSLWGMDMSTPPARRSLLVAVLTTICLGLVTTPASGASIGSRCTRLGAVVVVRHAHLKCVRVGKQLIWRGTTVSSTSKPSSVPSLQANLPDPLAGTTCTDAGHEIFPMSGPLRCVDGAWVSLSAADDSVASRAFRVLIGQYRSHPNVTPALRVIADPRASFATGPIDAGMRAAARLWAVRRTSAQPYPVLVGHDAAWLNDQTITLHLTMFDGFLQRMQQQESAQGGCSMGAFSTRQTQPWFGFCFGQVPVDETSTAWPAQVAAHEYTHLVQFALMDDVQARLHAGDMAPWFQEGFATFTAVTLSCVLDLGNDARSMWIPALQHATSTLADYPTR